MKSDSLCNQDFREMQENLMQREKQERLATATVTSETLSLLNISIDKLPQKCKDLLQQSSSLQLATGIDQLDPKVVSVRQSKEISKHLLESYELLELRQKNTELQRQIDRNKVFMEGLKKELENSKELLSSQEPNPDNIQEHMRQTKQKLTSYEEVYEKAKAKFTKLQVPESIFPKSIEELASRLATLKQEEDNIRQRAEDITLARKARDTLSKLRRA